MTSVSPSTADPIRPGSTIGILGGGQLGRMLAMAAAQLGYCCHVYAPDGDSVAADVSAHFTCAPYDDADALAGFAAACAVVTYEFENVPVAPLPALGEIPLRAPVRALEIAQDRLAEKRFVERLGGTPAPFMAVGNEAEFTAALETIGTPGILKTRRDGYDGKGQWRIMSPRDAEDLTLSGKQLIYEGFVDFAAEFSVILVRGLDGEIRFWDSAQNDHSSGILARSTVPAGSDGRGAGPRRARIGRPGGGGAGLCRRADAGILRHRPAAPSSTRWLRGSTIRATGRSRARGPASSRTISARSAACRWA